MMHSPYQTLPEKGDDILQNGPRNHGCHFRDTQKRAFHAKENCATDTGKFSFLGLKGKIYVVQARVLPFDHWGTGRFEISARGDSAPVLVVSERNPRDFA